jgi:lipopolysaccharide export system permease protein
LIIFRYITKEVLLTTFFILLIFLTIFLSTQLAMFLNKMADGRVEAGLLWQILGVLVVFLLPLLLPMSFFISLLLTYGRLYAESEMTVLFACGMTRVRLVFYTLILGLGMSLLVGYLSFEALPRMEVYKDALVVQRLDQNLIGMIAPGRFQSTQGGQKVFYVENLSLDKKHLENIFLAEHGGTQGNFLQGSSEKIKQPAPQETKTASDNQWSIVLAKRGSQEDEADKGGRFLVVQEGGRYIGAAGQKDLLLIRYGSYGVRLPEVKNAPSKPNAVEQWPTSALWKVYATNLLAASELQWRISIPLQIFLLALLAVPLSRTAPRQGRYVPLLPAILIYALYANGLLVARNLMEKGVLSVSIGLWAVHLILILLIIYLYAGRAGWHPKDKFAHYWRPSS